MTGSGTQQDPYVITTLEDLDAVRDNLSAYYELGADIDASDTQNWDNGYGWKPIGNRNNPFTGHFDGKGHTISGLWIHRGVNMVEDELEYEGGRPKKLTGAANQLMKEQSAGLFGYISGATVKNLIIRDVDFSTHREDFYNRSGNQVVWSGENGYGCIAVRAVNGSLIEQCAAIDIRFWDRDMRDYGYHHSNNADFGGIVGSLYNSTVRRCFVKNLWVDDYASISGGGLVGSILNSLVEDCFVHTAWIGNTDQDAGGVTQVVSGPDGLLTRVWTSHITWPDALKPVGSIGQITSKNQGTYRDSSHTGLPYGEPGICDVEVYWDSDTCDSNHASMDSILGEPKTTAELKDPSTFEGWDFQDTWRMLPGHTYPVLQWAEVLFATGMEANAQSVVTGQVAVNAQSEATDKKGINVSAQAHAVIGGELTRNVNAVGVQDVDLPGGGTPEDPYLISNLAELNMIREALDAHYKLVADIDASDTQTWGWTGNVKGWVPIGTRQNPFTGSLDGDGHTISGLYIEFNTSFAGYVGLFGAINGGTVKNVFLADFDIGGENLNTRTPIVYAGILAAYAQDSEFEMVGVSGGQITCARQAFDDPLSLNIEPDSVCGAFIGRSHFNVISRCYTEGVTVYGRGLNGGFIGTLVGGVITNCYSQVDIQNGAGSATGGFVAWTAGAHPTIPWTPTITRCYAACTIFSTPVVSVGGWIGLALSINGTSNFWDSTLSSKGGNGIGNSALGRPTVNMKQKSNYTDWDFVTIWTINEGVDYPRLITGFPDRVSTTIDANARSAGAVRSTRLGNAFGQVTRTTTITAQAFGLQGGDVRVNVDGLGLGTVRRTIGADARSKDNKEHIFLQANALGDEARQWLTRQANAIGSESTQRTLRAADAIGIPVLQQSTQRANAFATDPFEPDFAWPIDPSLVEREIRFETLITEFDSGKEQRRAKRDPVRMWRVRFRKDEVTASDIWGFYVNRRGAYAAFTWKDPITGELVKVRFAEDRYNERAIWKAMYETGITFVEVLE